MNTDEAGERHSAGEQTAVLPETASQLVELERLQIALQDAEQRAKNHWEQYLRAVNHFDAQWYRYFRRYRQKVLMMVYEGFAHHYEATVHGALDFLGIPRDGVTIAAPRLERQCRIIRLPHQVPGRAQQPLHRRLGITFRPPSAPR